MVTTSLKLKYLKYLILVDLVTPVVTVSCTFVRNTTDSLCLHRNTGKWQS